MKLAASLLLIFSLIPQLAFLQLSNDVGFHKGDVIEPPFAAEYYKTFDGFPTGGTFFNFGSNNQDSVYVSVQVFSSTSTIYSDTIGPVQLLAGDSLVIAEGLTSSFSPFDPPLLATPTDSYQLAYTINCGPDQNPNNNNASFPFEISSWSNFPITQANLNPDQTLKHSTFHHPDTLQEKGSCIVWQEEHTDYFVSNPYPYAAIGVEFVPHLETTATVFDPAYFLQVYEWNDPWQDLDDPLFQVQNAAFQQLNLIAAEFYYIDPPFQYDTSNLFSIPVVHPQSNQRYLVCVSAWDPAVGIGYDTTKSLSANRTLTRQPFVVNKIDTNWALADLSIGTPAISLMFTYAAWGIPELQSKEIMVYPNPAKSDVLVNFDVQGDGTIQIIGADSRVLIEKHVNFNHQPVSIDIQEIPRGAYIIRGFTGSGQNYFARFQKR